MVTFICKKCGATLSEGQKFCNVCGEPQSATHNENLNNTGQQDKFVFNYILLLYICY